MSRTHNIINLVQSMKSTGISKVAEAEGRSYGLPTDATGKAAVAAHQATAEKRHENREAYEAGREEQAGQPSGAEIVGGMGQEDMDAATQDIATTALGAGAGGLAGYAAGSQLGNPTLGTLAGAGAVGVLALLLSRRSRAAKSRPGDMQLSAAQAKGVGKARKAANTPPAETDRNAGPDTTYRAELNGQTPYVRESTADIDTVGTTQGVPIPEGTVVRPE